MQNSPESNSKKSSDTLYLNYKNEVDYERIRLLYQAGHNGLIGSLLIIIFFPIFMFNRIDHQVLTIWTILNFAVNLPRFFLLRSFSNRLVNNLITIKNVKRWEHYFSIGFCASGVVWATTAFLPYYDDIVICLLFVVLVQIGINAVVVSMYSSSKNMVLSYLTITLIPTYLKLFSTVEKPLIIVAIVGVAFLVVLVRAVRLHNQNLVKIISLKIQNDELSKKDTLTGLWNRRQLYNVVEKLIPRSIRHNETFAILLMDIDYFKKYNDTKGHTAGDELLKKISGLIESAIREEDLAVRYGGEEFLLLLPLATTQEAYVIGERIRQVIKSETDVTISGGISTFDATKSFDEMTITADNLLYKAKEYGRDMMCSSNL